MAECYKKARIYLKIFNIKLSTFSDYLFGTLLLEMFLRNSKIVAKKLCVSSS